MTKARKKKRASRKAHAVPRTEIAGRRSRHLRTVLHLQVLRERDRAPASTWFLSRKGKT